MSCGQSNGAYDVIIQWSIDNTGGADISYTVTVINSTGDLLELVMADNSFTVNGLTCSANHTVSVIAENCAGASSKATITITNLASSPGSTLSGVF